MSTQEPKTDYLKEDPTMAGQNYVVVSFVNPVDMVLSKQLYYVNKFLVEDVNKTIAAQAIQMVKKISVDMRAAITPVLDRLKGSLDAEDKHMSLLLEERFREMSIDEDAFVAECRREYTMNEEEITDKYKIFLSENRQPLDDIFNREHDQATSTRGFKIRGSFARIEDARDRGKYLRDNVEQSIHTFVAPVGVWFPVDMEADEVKEQDYLLPQLNDLMGKYHEGVQARNQHYQERKTEMENRGKTGPKSTKERMQEKLRQKKAAADTIG